VIEIGAMDEHRIGLKPILRRVWAPKGERPAALGHHRYERLYVWGFVQPASHYGVERLERSLQGDVRGRSGGLRQIGGRGPK